MSGPTAHPMGPRLCWPDLPSPYAEALRQAVDLILGRTEPVGIVACGSVVRGAPDRHSDLDIYVIHGLAWRQRIQRRFAGVPAEIFINPPAAVRGYFETERRAGRPVTAHMLSTGFVVLDRDPVVAALLHEASQILAQPPDLAAGDLQLLRYLAADLHENAQDVREADPLTGLIFLGEAVQRMVDYRFLAANHHLPRPKERLVKLAELDPLAADHTRRFLQAGEIDERYAIAAKLAAHILDTLGFFEWESERQTVK